MTRTHTPTELALMVLGVVLAAVVLAVVDAKTALWDDEQCDERQGDV